MDKDEAIKWLDNISDNGWTKTSNAEAQSMCRAISQLLKKLKEDNVRLDRENQKLIEQMAQQPQDDANDDDDYDPCYECRGLGDDYIINDDGELESWCDKCVVNPDRMKDKE